MQGKGDRYGRPGRQGGVARQEKDGRQARLSWQRKQVGRQEEGQGKSWHAGRHTEAGKRNVARQAGR